ncbi:hypothetical protein V8G54_012807 [Vigna mungo]|uniref:Uncharacterized protein n=1 Tax=Vigna mungo TaxID=3915 RepID=A0AAQ3S474_VIGMU
MQSTKDQSVLLSRSSTKTVARGKSAGSKKNDSYLKLLGGKSGKWLQKSPLSAGSQKNDSCLKRSGRSQENDFRKPRLTQEVRKMTPTSGRSREVCSGRSQENDSYLRMIGEGVFGEKCVRGEVKKMTSENPAQRRKTRSGEVCSGRSQENDFRKPRPTQEVRKMTPASGRSREVCSEGSQENDFRNPRSMHEKSPLNVGSQKNDSCLKPLGGNSKKNYQLTTQQVQLGQEKVSKKTLSILSIQSREQFQRELLEFDAQLTPNQEGLHEELDNRNIAKKDDRPEINGGTGGGNGL